MIENLELYNDNIRNTLKDMSFEELKNKTILITGANGLIASAVVDVINYLNVNERYNIKIIAMVRNKSNILERFKTYKNIIIIEQDVTSKIELDGNVDYIIHAASNAHPKAFSEDPVGTMLGNFIGMKNILDFSLRCKCKRIEYISSGEIYGKSTKEVQIFKEEYIGKVDPINPRSCYPLSKLASETLCVSYSKQYGVETVIARPCHIYGPTQTSSDSRVSAQFISNALQNKDIVMKSKGLQIRSYCYVLDCATAILTILLKGQNCNAYNIANKNSILSIKEMAEIIASKACRNVVFELPDDEEKKSYNPSMRSVLDANKLENLGWKAYWKFEDGIENTFKIMKENKGE